MIQLGQHAEGVILPVRAQPGARKARVLGEQAGALKVAVTAPPEDGRANKALAVNWEDELVKATALTKDGAVIHPNFQPK